MPKTPAELYQDAQRLLDELSAALQRRDFDLARQATEEFREARLAYIRASGGEMPGAPTRH